MHINVTVDKVDLAAPIGYLPVQVGEDEWEKEPHTLGQAVAAAVAADLKRDESYPGLRRRYLDLRDEEIRQQVKPIVAEAIAGPVQKTNSYGEPYGEPTTLRTLIVAQVEKLLKEPVDRYSRDKGTWLQKLIRDEVEQALRTEMAEAIKDEKTKIVAAVRAKAADLIATAVKEGVGR